MARLLACIFLLATLALRADDLDPHAFDPIVVVNGTLGGTPTFGAGIVFGREKDKLFIVTANHVVRTAGISATNLTVRLRTAPNKKLPAKLLDRFNSALDIAVLSVDNLAAQGIDICGLSLDRLAEPGAPERGDSVYPAGNPNGIPWALPVRPDAISDIADDGIVFESSLIARGHSGGGLLDDSGALIGMIQADEPPYGRALAIDRILKALRAWNYPLDLDLQTNEPPLTVASKNGDKDWVKRILQRTCADLNVTDSQDLDSLQLAAGAGNLDVVKLLVDAGADLKATRHGYFLVDFATETEGNNAAIVRLLLSRGAPCCGKAALANAAQAGNIEVVKMLLEHGADPSPALTNSSLEPIVRMAIQAGANVNKTDQRGETPLMKAMEEHQMASVRLLLAAGARTDVRVSGMSPGTAFERAAEDTDAGDHEMAALLANSSSPILQDDAAKLLDRAATDGWTDVVALLIQHGANVKGDAGGPALLHAATHQHVEIVKLLLEAGTDPDVTPYGGPTPLQSALRLREWKMPDDPALRLQIVKLLVSKGATVKFPAPDDPLYAALFILTPPDLDLAEFLIARGADVNAVDDDRHPYLQHAREKANRPAVAFLLQHGARDPQRQ